MLQSVPGQADGERLLAGDHVTLPVQGADERIPVNSCAWSHAGIMTPGV